jgi:hypothetical protein
MLLLKILEFAVFVCCKAKSGPEPLLLKPLELPGDGNEDDEYRNLSAADLNTSKPVDGPTLPQPVPVPLYLAPPRAV